MAKIKYILTVIIILCTITSYAQPAQYTPMTASGYQMKRLKVDSTLHLPSFCGVPTLRGSTSIDGALAIDTCGGFLYMWTRLGGWDTVNVTNTGSSTDTTSLSNRINLKIDSLKRSNDSVYAWINGTKVFQFKDSVGGGGTIPSLQQVLDVNATAYNKNFTLIDTSVGYADRSTIAFNLQRFGSDNYMTINDVNNYRIAKYSNQYARISSAGGNGKSVQIGWENTSDNFMSLSFSSSDFTNAHKIKSGSAFGTSYTTTIPPVTGTLAMSVNNQTADDNGNITITTGGVAVDTIYRTLGKDSIFYKKNNITYAIKDSVGTNPAPVGYYGAFQDTTIQSAVAINTPYAMKLGTTDLSNGITVVSDGSNLTRITFANAGVYNIQFSAQFDRTNSGTDVVDIWLRKNGNNVLGTGGKIVLSGGTVASQLIASWNYVVNASSNDYYQLMWSTPDTHVRLLYESAQTSPFAHPLVPSLILTVTQQSGIMAGTGISPLDTANMLSNYARTNLVNTKLNISDTASMLSSYSTRINGKLNIADTTVFQRKSIPSYTFLANNTTATANAQALTFKDTTGTYTNTITWGTSAPTGATNHSYRWTRIGNMVTLNISLVYGTVSSGNTQVTIALPSDAPTPIKPAGTNSASAFLYPASCVGGSTLTASTSVATNRGGIRNNSSNNGFEINMAWTTAATFIYFQTTVTYYTN